MYTIEIYDRVGQNLLASIREYLTLKIDFKLNDVSQCTFSLIAGQDGTDLTVLQKKNQVIVKKDGDLFWRGLINSTQSQATGMQVVCYDMLQMFASRIINAEIVGTLASVVQTIINQCVAKGPMFINNVDLYSETPGTFKFVNKTALECIKEVGNAGTEFYVFNDTLVLRDNVGTVQTRQFFFDEYYSTNNTIDEPQVEEQGKEIANVIYGQGREKLTTTQQDNTSIAKYGVLEAYVNFDSANDQTTLNKQAYEYLQSHKEKEINVSFDLLIKEEGDRDNLFLGDVVPVHIKKGLYDISRNMRVVGITYDIKSKSSIPGLSIEISDGDEALVNFFEDIKDMKKTINNVSTVASDGGTTTPVIIDLSPYATKQRVQDNFAPKQHTHVKADITDL